jgi:hypothetical protein
MNSPPLSNLIQETVAEHLKSIFGERDAQKRKQQLEKRLMEKILKIVRDTVRPECRDMVSRSEIWYQLSHNLEGIPMDHLN